MTKRIWLTLPALCVALVLSSAAHALVFSGTFTGIVTDSRINAEDPYNAGNIDGERATGTFSFETDTSALPPFNIDSGDGYMEFYGLPMSLTFQVHGYDLDFTPSEAQPLTADLAVSKDATSSALSIGAFSAYWSASLGFAGAANSLFADFDPATFNPLAVDVSKSSANFFAGRSFGGTVLLDGLTFDGYGAVGVPEPATYALMLAGLILLMMSKRRSAASI